MAWNNFFGKGSARLNNYISETIEIGFSQNGPTLAISGTLTARGNLVFINNISLLITKKADSYQHHFTWFAFRPHRFALSGYKEIELKMPSKFMVQPSTPYPYNILFNDQVRYAEMKTILNNIRKGWESLLHKNERVFSDTDYRQLFDEFIKTPECLTAQDELENLCYWMSGEYSLKAILIPQGSKHLIEDEKMFFLTSDDSSDLRANAAAIIADICRQDNVSHIFARPSLK